MNVEVDVLGPNSTYGLCGRKATLNLKCVDFRAQELCESRRGRPWKVDVDVLGSPFLPSLMVSVDVKQHLKKMAIKCRWMGRKGMN